MLTSKTYDDKKTELLVQYTVKLIKTEPLSVNQRIQNI